MAEEIAFYCPACAHEVERCEQSYVCTACKREFPVLFGIADFRLRSDRYLSLEEERAKAAALHQAAQTRSFEQLLAYYYEITGDVTPDRARRFASYAARGPARASLVFERFGALASDARLLDIGCGAGGALLAASTRFASVVGLDIALRWLVICRKRLDEAGVNATLVCADAAAPPFAPGQFSHVLGMDVAEHVGDLGAVLAGVRAQLRSGGLFWLSASNRRWIGPHPAVGVWAAAYRPARLRMTGKGANRYDPLRFTALLSPGEVKRVCEHAGFEVLNVGPRQIGDEDGGLLARAYAVLGAQALTRPLLTALGPAFEVLARAK
jgi:2-polyprenyl-3-methyl-5-hydroxy-6-metoxy-1,4-benzoquinol methylase